MIHADLPLRLHRHAACDERRAADRLPCRAEVVLAWNHDLGSRIRLRVLDISETGLRIASSMPILHGLTGVALLLLPEAVALNQVFVVKWVTEPDSHGGEYEAGLEFLT